MRVLSEQLPIAWEAEDGRPDKLAAKIHEMFSLAVRYPDTPEYQALAALKGQVRVRVLGNTVQIEPLERARQALYRVVDGALVRQPAAGIAASAVSSALSQLGDDDGLKAASDAERVDWKDKNTRIMSEWLSLRVKPQNKLWTGYYGEIEHLLELKEFARKNGLLMFYTKEFGGKLTFAQWERELEDAEWDEKAEFEAEQKREAEQVKNSPFELLREHNPDYKDYTNVREQSEATIAELKRARDEARRKLLEDDVRSESGVGSDGRDGETGVRESGSTLSTGGQLGNVRRDARAIPSIDELLDN
jgi:hypothetical protein